MFLISAFKPFRLSLPKRLSLIALILELKFNLDLSLVSLTCLSHVFQRCLLTHWPVLPLPHGTDLTPESMLLSPWCVAYVYVKIHKPYLKYIFIYSILKCVISAFRETRDQVLAHNFKDRWHLWRPTSCLHLSTHGRLWVSIWGKGFFVTSLFYEMLLHPNEPFPSNMIIYSSLWLRSLRYIHGASDFLWHTMHK